MSQFNQPMRPVNAPFTSINPSGIDPNGALQALIATTQGRLNRGHQTSLQRNRLDHAATQADLDRLQRMDIANQQALLQGRQLDQDAAFRQQQLDLEGESLSLAAERSQAEQQLQREQLEQNERLRTMEIEDQRQAREMEKNLTLKLEAINLRMQRAQMAAKLAHTEGQREAVRQHKMDLLKATSEKRKVEQQLQQVELLEKTLSGIFSTNMEDGRSFGAALVQAGSEMTKARVDRGRTFVSAMIQAIESHKKQVSTPKKKGFGEGIFYTSSETRDMMLGKEVQPDDPVEAENPFTAAILGYLLPGADADKEEVKASIETLLDSLERGETQRAQDALEALEGVGVEPSQFNHVAQMLAYMDNGVDKMVGALIASAEQQAGPFADKDSLQQVIDSNGELVDRIAQVGERMLELTRSDGVKLIEDAQVGENLGNTMNSVLTALLEGVVPTRAKQMDFLEYMMTDDIEPEEQVVRDKLGVLVRPDMRSAMFDAITRAAGETYRSIKRQAPDLELDNLPFQEDLDRRFDELSAAEIDSEFMAGLEVDAAQAAGLAELMAEMEAAEADLEALGGS